MKYFLHILKLTVKKLWLAIMRTMPGFTAGMIFIGLLSGIFFIIPSVGIMAIINTICIIISAIIIAALAIFLSREDIPSAIILASLIVPMILYFYNPTLSIILTWIMIAIVVHSFDETTLISEE